MRKKFVYYVLVPAVILLLTVYLFIDTWVKAGIENAGENVVGARVEISYLKVTFSPIGLRWDKIQVADSRDPWRNLFETGKVQFALDFGQLLRGKYVIETMEVNDLILGTKRTSNGSLPPSRQEELRTSTGPSFVDMAKAGLGTSIGEHSLISLDNLKTGIDPDSLVKAVGGLACGL